MKTFLDSINERQLWTLGYWNLFLEFYFGLDTPHKSTMSITLLFNFFSLTIGLELIFTFMCSKLIADIFV